MSKAPSAERKSRRGPRPLPPAERREHCVSVRLNADELARLDAARGAPRPGAHQRGEWLRMAALDRLPRTVPAVNAHAWTELARVAANLNQAQRAVNEGRAEGYPVALFDDLAARVAELRRLLIGVAQP